MIILKLVHKVWGASFIAIILCSSLVLTVQAHASLVRSDPADNSVVSTPPRTINLWFTEKIDAKLSSVQVWDAHSQPVQPVTIRVDPAEPDLLAIEIPQISNGIYSVNWKAFSTDDGHLTRGLFVFGVGSGITLTSSAVLPIDPLPDPQNVLITWLNYVTLLGLTGGIAIAFLVLSPRINKSSKESVSHLLISEPTLDRHSLATLRLTAFARLLKWLRLLGVIAFLVGIAMLYMQIMAIRNPAAPTLPSFSSSLQLIFQSRWGILWFSRQIILALFSLAISQWISSANYTRLTTLRSGSDLSLRPTFLLPEYIISLSIVSLSIGLVIVQALNSHAASVDLPSVAIGVDTVHLIAASFWVGGLAGMAISLFPLVRNDQSGLVLLLRSTWGKFSRVAAFSVGMVVASGLYSLGQQVASIDALITTTYGRGLLIKIGLFVACGCFGLLNSILLHPKLASPIARFFHRPKGWTPLSIRRRPFLVISELSLGILLIAMTAVITNSAPAHGQQFIPAEDIPPTVTSVADDLWVTFFVKPNQPGQNVLTIEVDNSLRPAPAPIQEVWVSINLAGQKGMSGPLTASQIDTNLYQVTSGYFDQMGDWQVSVTVRRMGFPDAVTLLPWVLAPPGGPRPLIISDQPLYQILTPLAALLLITLLIVFIATWPKKSTDLVPGSDLLIEPDLNQRPGPALSESVKDSKGT